MGGNPVTVRKPVMAIGSEDGSASRNATLGTAGQLAVAGGDASEAESGRLYAQLTQFRLLVLYTAWSIDKHKDYRKVRKDIATVKVGDAQRAA